MDTELILMQLFSGVALGAILVITALGLSIIFGMLGVVNFAHGALFMVGAYAGLWVASLTGSFWWGLLVAPIMIGLFGMLIEYFLIRPLYGRSIDDPLLLTFGLSYVLVEGVRIVFGTDHEQRSVREVHHAQHAEDDRQAERGKHEDRAERNAGEELHQDEFGIHWIGNAFVRRGNQARCSRVALSRRLLRWRRP